MRRQPRLDEAILDAFERACAESRLDVAEHLLCALEALESAKGVSEPHLAAAYRSIAAQAPHPCSQTHGSAR